MSTRFLPFGAGILAGLLFCAAFNGPVLFYLSFLPLLLVGLSMGARFGWEACFTATLTVLLLYGPEVATLYALLLGIPVATFLRQTLRYREIGPVRYWAPVLPAMATLAAFTAFVAMLIAVLVTHSGQAGFAASISEMIRWATQKAAAGSPPELIQLVRDSAGDEGVLLSFLQTIGWGWVLMLYALTVFSNRMLTSRGTSLRASLALYPGGLPTWLMGLVIVCGTLAFLGNHADRFAAEMCLLILALPYFLSGLAQVHLYSLRWRNRAFWLFVVYAAIFFFPPVGIALIAAGIYGQITELLDRRKKIG